MIRQYERAMHGRSHGVGYVNWLGCQPRSVEGIRMSRRVSIIIRCLRADRKMAYFLNCVRHILDKIFMMKNEGATKVMENLDFV
jgi:hypothetical protein